MLNSSELVLAIHLIFLKQLHFHSLSSSAHMGLLAPSNMCFQYFQWFNPAFKKMYKKKVSKPFSVQSGLINLGVIALPSLQKEILKCELLSVPGPGIEFSASSVSSMFCPASAHTCFSNLFHVKEDKPDKQLGLTANFLIYTLLKFKCQLCGFL